MMCVLVAARRTANAVVQLCKMVSHPSKYNFDLWVQL